MKAAGIMVVDPGGRALFVRRGVGGDHPGEWAFPGGRMEPGESPEAAARREFAEETGRWVAGPLDLLDERDNGDGVHFTTYGGRVTAAFQPRLSDEHVAFQWSDPAAPPNPLHPGVQSVLRRIAEDGDNMLAASGAVALPGSGRNGGHEATPIAFDEAASVRSYSKDGHLQIARTHISKAGVNEYRGAEIPDYEALGLDPQKKYRLLRHPDELAKGAATFNRLPILDRHVPVTADAHPGDITIGALGDGATFEDGYLDNGMAIWPRAAIDDIENDRKKELSAAYHYRADMTPGEYEGEPYDGIMRDIVGNHVALVKKGRAGSDVVVGDSMESLMAKTNKTVLSRKAVFACGVISAGLLPILAQDSAANPVDIAPLFDGVTSKNYVEKKAAIADGLRKLTKGRLAQDADIQGVIDLLDKLDGVNPAEGKDAAPPAGEGNAGLPVNLPPDDDTSMDADSPVVAKIKAMLEAAGVDPAIIAKVDEMAGAAEDADPDNPTDKDDKALKPAMDEAAVDARVNAAVEAERNRNRSLRTAEQDIEKVIGKVGLAFDSAEACYEHAFKALGVNVKGVPKEGYRALLLALPKPGERKSPRLAQDALPEGAKTFGDRYPGAASINTM